MNHENILTPKVIEDNTAVIHFTDMNEMLSCIDAGEYHWEDIGGEDNKSREKWTYGQEVVGRENLERALKMGQTTRKVYEQYHKQRAMLERKAGISKFLGRGLSCKRKRVVRDDGDDLSMSRLMGGSSQYWTTTNRESQRANVRIGMNIGVANGHTERDFIRLGATITLMGDIINKLGYAVEIIVFNFVEYKGSEDWKYFGMSIPMKMANEPLDIHRMLTSGLPGLFRDKCFGLMSKKYGFYDGLGYQRQVTDVYKKELNLLHVDEQKFVKDDEQAVDGLAKMMQDLAEKPIWMR